MRRKEWRSTRGIAGRHACLALVAVFLLACLAPGAWAGSRDDLFQTGYRHDQTSDGLDMNSWLVSYRNHRREMFWPWQDSPDYSLDWGLSLRRDSGEIPQRSFTAARLAALLGKRFSPSLYAEASGGMHRLNTAWRDELAIYSGAVYWSPSAWLDLHIFTNRDYLYTDAQIPAGITEALAARTYAAAVTIKPARRWHLNGTGKVGALSDGNRSYHYIYSLMYGVSPDWPWIWVGIGGETLHYDEARPGYWTPRNFRAAGLRFDSSVPLSESLEFDAALNLDRLHEDGTTGSGYYADVGFDWTMMKDIHLRLGAIRNHSLQQGSRWSERIYTVSLGGALP